ncbi:MAG: hypothetical protein OEV33_00230, partial [Armatimonadota bacterium]|nr:hypothetical protein [Armatimonadota bacterium]
MSRVWLRFVKISVLARLAYRGDLLLSVLYSSLFLLVYLSIWRALYNNPGAEKELVPYSAMALYVAGGAVLRSWLSSDPEFFIRKIRSGDIAG